MSGRYDVAEPALSAPSLFDEPPPLEPMPTLVPVEPVGAQRPPCTIQEAFERFDRENPWVLVELRRMALDLVRAGHERPGSGRAEGGAVLVSRKRGAQHRRRPRRSHHGLGVCIIAGWGHTEADLPEVRQQTHDRLIELMGETRRTGVKWVWGDGDRATQLLDTLVEDNTPDENVAYYALLRRMLAEEGGYIVLAMADGDPI